MPSTRPTFISINLVSNRPKEFSEMMQNIEQTAYDPKRVEVLVRIDDKDEPMQQLVRDIQKRSDLKLKFLSMPYTGFLELYKSFDPMHYQLCDPDVYFVQHFFDELRFVTPHWDKILEERYTGLFDDNIYRLRTSMYKFWNYHSVYECGPHPENLPIVTKKWIDLTGWCPCHSADSYQQMIAYYLGVASDGGDRFYRDVPLLDIKMEGLEAGVGLQTLEEIKNYEDRAKAAFQILFSDEMQAHAQQKANILRAHIKFHKLGKAAPLVAQSKHATHVFDPVTKEELMTFPILQTLGIGVGAPAASPNHALGGRAVPLCVRAVQFAHRCVRAAKSLVKRILGR